MSKSIEKQIDKLRDEKTHLWAAILATFGGTFGVSFLSIPVLYKIMIMAVGSLLIIVFMDKYIDKDIKIVKMINFLAKQGE